MSTKVSTGFGWLEDDVTGDPAGVRRHSDGKEFTIPLVETDPVTGRIKKIEAGGASAYVMDNLAERFAAIIGSRPIQIELYGNSIIANEPNPFTAAVGYFGGRIRLTKNHAVGGYTSAQVLAKLLAEGARADTDVVAWQEGTNDASQSVPLATHVANMKAIAEEIIRLGKIPLLLLAPPNDQSYSAASNAMNLRERFIAEALGIPFYDPYMRYLDTDGTWTAGTSADLVHPLPDAVTGVGSDLFSAISTASPPLLLPRSNAGEGLLASNALMLTDTNSDGLPDGWMALSLTSPTYSLSNATYPARGKKCSVTVSQSITGYVYREISSGFSVGDVVRVTGFAGLSATSAGRLRAFIRNFGSSLFDFTLLCTAVADGMHYFEAQFSVPEGTTKLQLYMQMNANTSGAFSCAAEFASIDIYNVTAMRALVL